MSDIITIILVLLLFVSNLITIGVFIYLFRYITANKNTISVQDIKDELPEESGTPLEQFQPDFTKPVKLVYKENEDQTILEEVEDEKSK